MADHGLCVVSVHVFVYACVYVYVFVCMCEHVTLCARVFECVCMHTRVPEPALSRALIAWVERCLTQGGAGAREAGEMGQHRGGLPPAPSCVKDTLSVSQAAKGGEQLCSLGSVG